MSDCPQNERSQCVFCNEYISPMSLYWTHVGECAKTAGCVMKPASKQQHIPSYQLQEHPAARDPSPRRYSRRYPSPPPAPQLCEKPGYRCTLCNLWFYTAEAQTNHVKSAEHTAKIMSLYHREPERPQRIPTPPEPSSVETSSPSLFDEPVNDYGLTRSELEDMVRQVIREELPAMLRTEMRKLFLGALEADAFNGGDAEEEEEEEEESNDGDEGVDDYESQVSPQPSPSELEFDIPRDF